MVGRSPKVRLCQLISGQPHAGIAKKELASPLNQEFANHFQAGRAGLGVDFGWQILKITTLPTFFRLTFAWGGQIMVGRSPKVRLCQLFSGQPHAGIGKKELASQPNLGFANHFQAG